MSTSSSFTRRLFVTSSAASLTALSAARLFTPQTAQAQSASRIRTVGAFEVQVLSDGNLQVPVSMMVGNERLTEIKPALDAAGLPSATATPALNIAVIRTPDDLIVVDGGAGPNFQSSAGLLVDALDAAGIDPGDVTKVVLSHAHPDHLWGLYDDFEEGALFYDAEHFVHQAELSYWLDDGLLNRLPEGQLPFAVAAQRLLPQFDWTVVSGAASEIVSGVTLLHSPGHTAGHLSVALTSGPEALLITGDAFTHPYISFAHPQWAYGTDEDAELGIKTRLAVLEQLASDNMMALAYHMPTPGFITVSRAASGGFDYSLV